jgi:glycosyltransferase involved in cell wall biosynthesis
MKIAFVSQPIDTVLHPYQNSVGACTYGAACALAKHHEVVVYGLADRHDRRREVSERNVRFRFVSSTQLDRLAHRYHGKWLRLVQKSSPMSTSGWLYPDYGRQVARDMAKQSFDVIHIQHCTQYVPLIRKLNPRARIVLHLHAEWFSQNRPARLTPRLKGLDLLCTVSDHITDKTKRQVPEYSDRCQTIYNGIDADEFHFEKSYHDLAGRREKRIMYAGGVSPHKGIHCLLDAFKLIVAELPDVRLEIIGPHGTYPLEENFDLADRAVVSSLEPFYQRNRLLLLQRKLFPRSKPGTDYISCLKNSIPEDIRPKVEFLGMIPRADLVQHYYEADVFVFPAIWDEGFGLPPVEAMASGTAVVASRSGAVAETVRHREIGLLVVKNDVNELAQAILAVLRSDAMRERMGRAGRQRALEYFTWDRVAARMSNRYAGLLAADRQPDWVNHPVVKDFQDSQRG